AAVGGVRRARVFLCWGRAAAASGSAHPDRHWPEAGGPLLAERALDDPGAASLYHVHDTGLRPCHHEFVQERIRAQLLRQEIPTVRRCPRAPRCLGEG
ncbi:unnamed protein product, partial [Prorocentrum cordatum]